MAKARRAKSTRRTSTSRTNSRGTTRTRNAGMGTKSIKEQWISKFNRCRYVS